MKGILAKIEFGYYAILPYLALVAVGISGADGWMINCLVMLGWVTLLVYQIFCLGILKTSGNRSAAVFMPLIPILILLWNRLGAGGTVWEFFLDQIMVEMVAMFIAMSIVFITVKGPGNRYAWQELGILPFFFIALISLGSIGFVQAWWEMNQGKMNEFFLGPIPFLISMVIEVVSFFFVLKSIVKREYEIPDIFEGKYGAVIVLGQIVLWCVLAVFLLGWV